MAGILKFSSRYGKISQVSKANFSSWMSSIFSPRESHFAKEKEIKNKLRTISEPITQQSIVSLGSIQSLSVSTVKKEKGDSYKVVVKLDFFVPGYPFTKIVIDQCKAAICSFDWVVDAEDVTVEEFSKTSASSNLTSSDSSTSTMHNVKHVIAVSSCKGGVGKSTVAVNLAFALASRGLKVGLLDADIYGPSLPSLVQCEDNNTVRRSPNNSKFILPLVGPLGVKMLSFGHVNPKAGAPGAGGKGPALMRGPIASKLINQLIGATEWGELDYMVVDMPPGTGDIQLTLSQTLAFTGAVIVTTPHYLSLVDAAKGVAMFQEVNVPTLAVVENMSYFDCEHGSRYYPFGKGGRDVILQSLDSSSLSVDATVRNSLSLCPFHSFPLSEDLAYTPLQLGENMPTDKQFAVVLRNPNSVAAKTYQSLSHDIIAGILKIHLGALLTPWIGYVEGRGIVLRYFTAQKAQEFEIPHLELRIRDPKTGLVIPGESVDKYSSDCKPVKFDIKGNYGVAVVWSDGYYADIFAYGVLREIAEGFVKESQ